MDQPTEPTTTPLKVKRTATTETRRKQSDAHSGEKHHYYGVARAEGTKTKIARTLSSITRFDFDNVTALPAHMKTVSESNTIGYVIVGHEVLAGSKIKFSSKRSLSNSLVIATLRAKCVFYLEHLNACAASGTAPIPKVAYMIGFSDAPSV